MEAIGKRHDADGEILRSTVASAMPMRAAISRADSPSTLAQNHASRQRGANDQAPSGSVRNSCRAMTCAFGARLIVAISSSSRSATASIGTTCSRRKRSIKRLRAMANTNGLCGRGDFSSAQLRICAYRHPASDPDRRLSFAPTAAEIASTPPQAAALRGQTRR